MSGRTCVDLFAGIGGFSAAASACGYEIVAQVEIDPTCREYLRSQWGDIQHEDIRTFDGRAYAGATLLAGGPPCQPASRAGKQRGDADDRWLWPEAIRVLREVLPAWALFENPPGIGDVGLAGVLAEVGAAGYEVRVLDIPACAVGAPHRRSRYWIICRRMDNPDDRHGRPGDAIRPGRDADAVPTKGRVADAGMREQPPDAQQHGEPPHRAADGSPCGRHPDRCGHESRMADTDGDRHRQRRSGERGGDAERQSGHDEHAIQDAGGRGMAHPRRLAGGQDIEGRRACDGAPDRRDSQGDMARPASGGQREHRDAPGLPGHPDERGQDHADVRPCRACGYEFDHATLGKYGCPNCEGTGLMAHASGSRREGPDAARRTDGLRAEHREGLMGDAERSGRGGRRLAERCATGARAGDNRPGPWDDAIWLPCADNKVRRAPGPSFLLADGMAGDALARLAEEGWPHRSLLAALGNAIVPQVAYRIIRAIRDADTDGAG